MEADYVIVGAGSAGCAIAYRLAEAGRSVIRHRTRRLGPGAIHPDAGRAQLPMNMARYDWGLKSEPEPHLGGPADARVPRGKVIGGSSSMQRQWSTCAATANGFRPHGPRPGPQAGASPMSFPTSKRMEKLAPRPFMAATVVAGAGRAAPRRTGASGRPRCFRPSVEGAGRPATRRNRATTARSRKASGRWSRRCGAGRRLVRRHALSQTGPPARQTAAGAGPAPTGSSITEGRAARVEIARRGPGRDDRARPRSDTRASSINSPKLLMLSGHRSPRSTLRRTRPIARLPTTRAGVGANLQEPP